MTEDIAIETKSDMVQAFAQLVGVDPGIIEKAEEGTAIKVLNRNMNEFWRWSKHNLRDQISFNYVIWKLGLLPSQQPKSSATIRGSDTAAQIQDNADSRGFAHFQAGGGNQSLSPARSGRKSRLLLVHNGHNNVVVRYIQIAV